MMKSQEVYVLGIGGSTPLFMDLALSCGVRIAGLFHYNDERTGDYEYGYPILGSFADLFKLDLQGKCFLLSQGNMKIRKDITVKIRSLGGSVPSFIHPSAEISRFATISREGVIIGAKCVVQAGAEIQSDSVLRDMALVCHQATIANYCFVGPKALVGAHIYVDNFAFIGQGSLLVSGKVRSIGVNAVVGAGSVVTKEVPANIVVVGNPARELKSNL